MQSKLLLNLRLLVLPIVLLTAPVSAQDLRPLLSSHRYSEAFQEAKKLPPVNVISQVAHQARGNDAPAQWILAEAYWRGGQKEQAVQWGYTALVSTELDASGCRNSSKVVPWMMQAYQYIFSEARRRPDLQSDAIKSALVHHAQLTTLPADQAWACRLGAKLEGAQGKTSLRMPLAQTLKRRRADALKDLIKTARVKIEVASSN